jgi:hypothetical protein
LLTADQHQGLDLGVIRRRVDRAHDLAAQRVAQAVDRGLLNLTTATSPRTS